MPERSVDGPAQVAVVEYDLAPLDEVARQAEHPSFVMIGSIDRHIAICTRAEMPLAVEPEHSSRTGPGDNGDLGQRILSREVAERAPSLHRRGEAGKRIGSQAAV